MRTYWTTVHAMYWQTQVYFLMVRSVQVGELDWLQSWPSVPSYDVEDGDEQEYLRDESAYTWSEKDLEEARSATVLLAADVVYSPELRLAFFEVLDKIMDFGSTKTMFLALEKRFNFSVDELDVVAYGYSNSDLTFLQKNQALTATWDATEVPNDFQWKFEGRQIPIEEVQQHIVEYERGKDLELWEIMRCRCKGSSAKIQ